MPEIQVPQNTIEEMKHIKAWYPYRIVFCVYDGATFEVYVKTTKHTMNAAMRKGHKVWTI